MTNIDAIRDIADPGERARKAEEHARAVKAQADEHRARRNMAMLSAIEHDDAVKAHVYQQVGVSRSTLVKIEAAAPAEIPKIEDALTVAKNEQETLLALDAEVAKAREIRDSAVLRMLLRDKIANHQVVRDTGLSGVRVAQLRASALT